jgi:hypothetical protein
VKNPENKGGTEPPAMGHLGAAGNTEPQDAPTKFPSTYKEAADRYAQIMHADSRRLSDCQRQIKELEIEKATLSAENKYLLLDRRSKEFVLIVSYTVTALGGLGLSLFSTATLKWVAATVGAFGLFFSLLFGIMIWIKDTRPDGTNRRLTLVLLALIILVIAFSLYGVISKHLSP